MDEPSMSELELKYNDLLWQINNLELAAPAPPPPPTPDGVFIPAGTIVTCRPSRAAAMIKRLGGEENVEIVDSVTTEGFARGRHKDAAPWTNEVYPYDIGPSCGGTGPENVLISSDVDRVSAPPVNNCITADNWNPAVMFSGEAMPSGKMNWVDNYFITATRIFYLTRAGREFSAWTMLFNFTGEPLFYYGALRDPYYQANPNIESQMIWSNEITITAPGYMSYSNVVEWEKIFQEKWPIGYIDFTDDGLPDTNSTFTWTAGKYNREIKLVDPDALYIIVTDDTRLMYDMATLEACGFGTPYKISIFSIAANAIDNAAPTPVIKYGGYARDKPPGSGPAPKWSRTNLVQLKILQDVTIEA
jgi:hypothetical protein